MKHRMNHQTDKNQTDKTQAIAIAITIAIAMFQRRKTPPPYKRVNKHQSAASKKAAEAATVRTTDNSSNPTNHTKKKGSSSINTSSVQKTMLPKQIFEHDPKEVILRCAQRIAPYSLSVDTLVRSLRTIRSNPNNTKYQSIDTSSTAFQRSLNAPGVMDFLRAMNFRFCSASTKNYNTSNSNSNSNRDRDSNHTTMLTLLHFDPAVFYLGISALEQIQQTSRVYKKHKALRTFQKEIDTCFVDTNIQAVNENELSARQHYLSKLPRAPSSGGSPITIEFGLPVVNTANSKTGSGDHSRTCDSTKTDRDNDKPKKISRDFDHDDTLDDVVNWLGGHINSSIPTKLRTGEWNIVDRNRMGSDTDDFKYYRLDVTELSDKTLHCIGCWPSARIAIVPAIPAK